MAQPLFTIVCPTCQSRLQVKDAAMIGQILACPKCGGMVQVQPPAGWSPEQVEPEQPSQPAPPRLPEELPPDLPAPPPVPSGREEPVGEEELPMERRRRTGPGFSPKLLLTLFGALAGVALVAGLIIALWPGEKDVVPDGPVDAVVSEEDGLSQRATMPLAVRYVPADAVFCFSAPSDAMPWLPPIISQEELGLASVIQRFGLNERVIHRVSYATSDLQSPAENAIILIELREDQDASSLALVGELASVSIGETPCRQYADGVWTHPFAILDERTILTGNEQLLASLADPISGLEDSDEESDGANLPDEDTNEQSPEEDATVARRAWAIDVDCELLLLLDVEAASSVGWSIPPAWMHVWPEMASEWKTAFADARLVEVLLAEVKTPEPDTDAEDAEGHVDEEPVASSADADSDTETPDVATAEDALADDALAKEEGSDASTGDEESFIDGEPSEQTAPYMLRFCVIAESEDLAFAETDRLNALLATVRTWIGMQAEIASLLARADRLEPEPADAFQNVTAELLAATNTSSWRVDGKRTWLEIGVDQAVTDQLVRPKAVAPALEAAWLTALEQVEHDRLVAFMQSLEAYKSDHDGGFPAGVIGGGLLPAETRLSWIAEILPQLEHPEWAEELDRGGSWNSTHNAAVTKRVLEAVSSPIAPGMGDADGYPVTRYVGLAGLGENAADEPADSARAGIFAYTRATSPDEILDGLSNTIAVAPVQDGLGPWAAGGNATVRPMTQPPYVNGPDGFGCGLADGMWVGMADGSVKFLAADSADSFVEALTTINGGESVPSDWGERPSLRELAGPEPDGTTETVNGGEEPISEPPTDVTPTTPGDEIPEDVAAERPPVRRFTPEEILSRLELPITGVDLKGTPRYRAIRMLAGMSGVPVTFDLDAARSAGVDLLEPVTINIKPTTLAGAIGQLTEPEGLVLRINEGQLLVTVAESAQEEVASVEYAVADLAAGVDAGNALAERIKRLVAPDSWPDPERRIEVAAGKLTISQTPGVHEHIVSFLERLRVARGLPMQDPSGDARLTTDSPLERAEAVLMKPVMANYFHAAPLPDVLVELERQTDGAFIVHWISLASENVGPETPATVVADAAPLAQTLIELLRPLDATYRVVGANTFEIVSLHNSEPTVAIIPISDLVQRGADPNMLIQQIETELLPDAWRSQGGAGAIEYDEPSQSLLIRQDDATIVLVELLIEGVRQKLSGTSP